MFVFLDSSSIVIIESSFKTFSTNMMLSNVGRILSFERFVAMSSPPNFIIFLL